ncbi:MAG: hypothetical protein ACOCUU_01710 [Nanoarchaeota archaeon]
MDLKVKLLIDRALNEILTAKVLKKLSEVSSLKKNLEIPKDSSFYSDVIGHSYYALFYSAKAYLLSMKVNLKSQQGQHQQVYYEFRKLVYKGIIDKDLLNLYNNVKGKAEILLDILKTERAKRTNFTYKTLPQANKFPAEESLDNAISFVSHIRRFLKQ